MLCKPKNIVIIAVILFCSAFILTSCAVSGSSAVGDSVSEIPLISPLPEVDFDRDYPVGQITNEVTVMQDFISRADEITQLWLYGATYIRENTATVVVRLYKLGDDTDNLTDTTDRQLIAEWHIDSSEMSDNAVIKLNVSDSDINKGLYGAPCLIEISSPDGEPDLSPTFWMTEEDIYPDGHLTINGYEQYNDLWFEVMGR